MNKEIDRLNKERVKLSVSLRHCHAMLKQRRSPSLMVAIIKRDVAHYITLCNEVQELTQMMTDLSELFTKRSA